MNSKILSTVLFAFFLILNVSITAQDIDANVNLAVSSGATSVEVIITFQGSGAPTPDELALLNSLGIVKGVVFQALPMVGTDINISQLNSLSKNPSVRSIFMNRKMDLYNYKSRNIIGVDRLRSDAAITSRNGGLPVSGKGIGVLINDTGIDGTHSDLKYGLRVVQNVIGSVNLNAYSSMLPISYVENVPNTDELGGHGTHVAGTVGGTGAMSNGMFQGVAPGADLIGYGSGAELFVLDGLGGFNYALTHQYEYNIRVISNSWGSSGNFDPSDPINIATKACYDHNIVVTFAAGNSGPAENTLNPYAVAPWVISVAAGDDQGRLADFSSRGVENVGGTFTMDGQQWTYQLSPTITAPGVLVTSCRALVSNLLANGLTDDTTLSPAYLPYYTIISGTSMATPHVSGVVALMLEANKSLTPDQVKQIIEQTATNISARSSWEAGYGYINAYAAVEKVFNPAMQFGGSVNASTKFNSNVNYQINRLPFSIDYNPVPAASSDNNQFTFTVAAGTNTIEAQITADGLLGQTGNTLNLVLIAPDGTEFSSGVNLLFPLYFDRSVSVTSPAAGNWILQIRGLRGTTSNPTDGAALPQTVTGTLSVFSGATYTGLSDISNNAAASSILFAVSGRLMDGYPDGTFKPNNVLTRIQLADYLMMGSETRQYLSFNGGNQFTDVPSGSQLFASSVTATGSALTDVFQTQNGVMLPYSATQFFPNGAVYRQDVAYSMVQSLGFQDSALAHNNDQVSVQYNGQSVPIDDANQISSNLRGYVQLALNLNLINAYFSLTQGPNDLQPTIHAAFKPTQKVLRADYAVIITRTFNQWINGTAKVAINSNIQTLSTSKEFSYSLKQNYPNPFNPSTNINYSVEKDGLVSLVIYNALGQKVQTLVNEFQPAGKHNVSFNANSLPSGFYIYKLASGNYSEIKKMMLLK